jgi:hypothetical protein
MDDDEKNGLQQSGDDAMADDNQVSDKSSNEEEILTETIETEPQEPLSTTSEETNSQDSGDDNPQILPANINDSPINGSQKKQPKRLSRRAIIALIIIVGLSAVGGAMYYLAQKDEVVSEQSQEVVAPDTENAADTTAPEEIEVEETTPTKTIEGIQWLESPQQLPYQDIYDHDSLAGWLTNFDQVTFEEAQKEVVFFKVGSYENKDVIVGDIAGIGYVFLVDGNEFTLLTKDSYTNDKGLYYGPTFLSNVKEDTELSFKELQVPEKLSYGGATIKKIGRASYYDDASLNDLAMSEVASSDYGKIYESTTTHGTSEGVKQLTIYLKLRTGMYVPFRYDFSMLNDDNSVTIKWKDGSESTDTYRWETIAGGCGLVESVNVLDKKYFDQLVEIGSAGSTTVLTFKDTSSEPFKTIYENTIWSDEDKKATSMQKFLDDKGVILFRSELGYRPILTSTKYSAGGECGKPVIYLYPESTTTLHLEVGADVKVSEPTYEQGWNVTAYPDGSLYVGGQKYDSLFWEGTGYGRYPEITEGFVVPKSQLRATLLTHLAELGLNQKETQDFMEYWMPRMPETPYTRLTWFGTSQMNELAPLSLTVKPDTTIRIFLDFEGLDERISLKEQQLGHSERHGFTLVEWGGLLRDGIEEQ